MDDLISRQDAIDALETVGYDFSDSELSAIELEEVCEAVGDVRQDMINRIKRLPSAQPEPDHDLIHLQKEQAYMQGWEDGRKSEWTAVARMEPQPEPYRKEN